MHVPVLPLLLIFGSVLAERCPPVFGEFECPVGFICKDSQCYGKTGSPSTVCGFETDCSESTICVEGKCYPHSAIKCNRHVLTADGQARSIVSDCGRKGKCVNGQCMLDRCLGVSCGEGELCRDGECVRTIRNDSTFSKIRFQPPRIIGRSSKVEFSSITQQSSDLDTKDITSKTPEPICNCHPHEICHHGQCYPNSQCTSVFCGKGSYCVDGKCVNGVGVDCHEENCRGGTVCVNGVCVLDPCPASCPADQSCRLGECRIMEGLPCIAECSGPYTCVDGYCRRNDCERRVCQLGEACEGGQCHRVVGRFCTWAPRDCGHAFTCKDNQCFDLLAPITTIPPHQDNRLPN